jgi:chromosome segregation ATPase
MSTQSDTQTTQSADEALRAELAQAEEKLRKLVRHIDQLGRTEFRDRAQRLKQMRDQRAELEAEIDVLKTKLKGHK